MNPMDLARRLLKMPIVDTDIPGVRMGYNENWIHPHNYPEPTIGNQPYFTGWDGKRNEKDEITQMTPNEYFDIIQALSEKEGGVDRGHFTAPPIPGKDAEYRWDGMFFTPWSNSRKNIARIMEGIEEGKPIGMPSLYFRDGEFTGEQDGGHRMEALRQMGHGDTPVPVFRRHPHQVKTGEPMDLSWRLLKVDDEIPDFSDEPVDQCEMCNKYLHDSDYHVLNDHNFCSDCYNQLAEPEEFDYEFQDKLTGEPMDLTWRLLKRQTELGEFHEDFPSSLGPVTEYHGTMNLPAVSEQGIKARSSRKRSKKYVPEQLRGQDITYTTPDQERALAFAQERAQSLGLPSSQVGVVGVRAGDLPSPIQHQEPFGVLGGTMSNVRPSAIPRANIVPMRGDM